MVITFSNIKGSAGSGGATGGTVSGITLWSDETTKAYIDNALSGVTDVLTAYTKTEDFATINGSGITSGGNLVIEETPYTAGTNIDITDHIISVTGITIPTKVSELVNDSGYITTADTQNFVTSGDVQTQINDSISGKADSSAVTAQISEVKAQIEAEIPTKVSSLENDLNFASTGDVKTQIDNAVSGKQDTLVSGTNIKTINNQSLLGSGNIEIQGGGETYSAGEGIGIDADNIISVTGNYETIVELTQAEYDALTSYGKNTTYVITDAPAVNLSAYTPTSGFSTINGNVITDGGNIEIQGGNTYTAGANIDISTDNVISVTGITMPTKLSELTNDEGFVNSGEVETQITNKDYSTKNWVQDQVNLAIASETARTESTYAKIGDIPSLDGYATTGWVESQGYITGYTETDPVFQASAASGISAQDISNWNAKLDSSDLEPYYTSAQTDNAISNATSGKQDTLVSGVNIKTINSQSLLGSGNIQIQGGSGGSSYTAGDNIDITNDVISVTGLATINGSAITEGGNIVIQGGGGSGGGETVIELTQAQYDALTGYAQDTTYIITDAPSVDLDNYYTSAQTESAITAQTSLKQDTLVSGTNIKTINGQSILGNGDIYISQGIYYNAGAGLNLINGNTFEVKDYDNLKQGARLGEIEKIISIALNDLNNRLKKS